MSDVTQGQDALSDTELFQGATDGGTLDKFENPDLPADKPADKPAEKPADKIAEKPTDHQPDAPVPAGRLREESERARRAEAERDAMRAQLEALSRQQQPQKVQQPAQADIFESPAEFIRQQVEPLFKSFQEQLQETREQMSLDNAISRHGQEAVDAAKAELVQGIRNGDPAMKAMLDRAMKSHDPYGVIVRHHRERETMSKIGGDLDAYNKSVLEKALDDPEYLKRAIEKAQGKARATGQVINRPARSSVPTTPSLANIGAGGGDEQTIEPSDEQLFRQATSAKRR